VANATRGVFEPDERKDALELAARLAHQLLVLNQQHAVVLRETELEE
jgi:hypothetical protein